MRKRTSTVVAAAAVLVMAGCDAGGNPGQGSGDGPSEPDFPTRSIELIIPFGPGGNMDPMGREFSRLLGEDLGTSFVVQNIPGGDTTIGVNAIVQSAADGYTLGAVSTAGVIIQPLVNPDLDYTIDDFVVINTLAEGANAIVVAGDSPYQTFDDFLTAAEAAPGQLSISTTGRYISTTFVAVALEDQAGLSFNIVPYAGAGEAVVAVMGGEVDAAVITAPGQVGLIESGDLRVLAYTGTDEGDPLYAQGAAVSFSDAGYDVPFPAEYMTIAPAGLPDEVLAALEAGSERVLSSAAWRDWAGAQGLVPGILWGDAAREWFESTYEVTENVVRLLEGRFGE